MLSSKRKDYIFSFWLLVLFLFGNFVDKTAKKSEIITDSCGTSALVENWLLRYSLKFSLKDHKSRNDLIKYIR